MEFFRVVPTVRDETRVVQGRIGEFAAIARRKGDAWFLGTINAGVPRTLPVSLAFLAAGRKYVAHVYSDDPATPTATHVGISTRVVDAATTLDVPLLANGGQAVWLEPR